jgi:phosphoribosylaminoimidazole-succinocarboxamide synthase
VTLASPPKHARGVTQVLPEAPRELVCELSRRYVYLYEKITGQHFQPPSLQEPVRQRMERNMAPYL